MKQYLVVGLAAALMVGALLDLAPPASAGCQYVELVVSKCDGPVQADGTWQRCVVFQATSSSDYLWDDKRCDVMGPDQHPWGFAFNDPPTHIDD